MAPLRLEVQVCLELAQRLVTTPASRRAAPVVVDDDRVGEVDDVAAGPADAKLQSASSCPNQIRRSISRPPPAPPCGTTCMRRARTRPAGGGRAAHRPSDAGGPCSVLEQASQRRPAEHGQQRRRVPPRGAGTTRRGRPRRGPARPTEHARRTPARAFDASSVTAASCRGTSAAATGLLGPALRPPCRRCRLTRRTSASGCVRRTASLVPSLLALSTTITSRVRPAMLRETSRQRSTSSRTS